MAATIDREPTDTPDLCDCTSSDDHRLKIADPNPDGPGCIYRCDGCGFEGVVV